MFTPYGDLLAPNGSFFVFAPFGDLLAPYGGFFEVYGELILDYNKAVFTTCLTTLFAEFPLTEELIEFFGV